MTDFRTIDSPIGLLTLAGSDGVLTHLRMVDQTHEPSRTGWSEDPTAFADAVDQLGAYFAGELTDFELKLDLRGSEFQRRVWQALLPIPYGKRDPTGRSPNRSVPGVRLVPSDLPTATTQLRSWCRVTE